MRGGCARVADSAFVLRLHREDVFAHGCFRFGIFRLDVDLHAFECRVGVGVDVAADSLCRVCGAVGDDSVVVVDAEREGESDQHIDEGLVDDRVVEPWVAELLFDVGSVVVQRVFPQRCWNVCVCSALDRDVGINRSGNSRQKRQVDRVMFHTILLDLFNFLTKPYLKELKSAQLTTEFGFLHGNFDTCGCTRVGSFN